MITIAYCIHSLHRAAGMERVVSVKANLLARTGEYKVYILTASLKGRKPAFDLDSSVSIIDIGVNEKLRQRKYAAKLGNILKNIGADICISTGGAEIYALPRCSDGSIKIAEFHFSHDKFLLKYGKNAVGRWYASLRTKKLEKAVAKLDCFVTLTERDREDWEKYLYDIQSAKEKHIKNKVDEARSKNGGKQRDSHIDAHNTKIDQIYNPLTFNCSETASLDGHRCIAIGRLDRQKNFEDLIRAWKEVRLEVPDARLDIYGEGSLHKNLQSLIDTLLLSDSICLKGRTNNIEKELLNSSCIAMSSLFEGFPMVLLESAACGVPMISYDCPQGPSEIIEDGVNGKLVKYRDTNGLAKALIEVLSNGGLRKSMGVKAKATSDKFSPELIIRQWDELFRSLVAEQRNRLLEFLSVTSLDTETYSS